MENLALEKSTESLLSVAAAGGHTETSPFILAVVVVAAAAAVAAVAAGTRSLSPARPSWRCTAN